MATDYLSFHLPTEFVQEYVDRPVNWGFDIGGGNSLAELTYITKYSMKREDGTKERWYETCERVINGMFSILKDYTKRNGTYWNENKANHSAKEAYDLMFQFKWTPPGRGMQNMGKHVVNGEHNAAMLYNCFAGEEEIVTPDGLRTLKSLLDSEVTVLTSKGWEMATVKSFGQQKLQKITFRPGGIRLSRGKISSHKAIFGRSNTRVEVRATPDHRWILEDGSQTTSLKEGDWVPSSNAPVDENDDYWDGFIHGLFFGDGTKCKVSRVDPFKYANGEMMFKLRAADNSTKLQMFNPKVMERITKTSSPPSNNGDHLLWVRTATDLKVLPYDKSKEYSAGFLNGWICADGTYTNSGSIELHSQHPDAQAWVTDKAGLSGYTLLSVGDYYPRETNFGPRKNTLWTFTLRHDVLWRVESIEEDGEEEVYCAVVPESAEFTLASGILTGNCSFLSTEKLSSHSAYAATRPFVLLMEQSMNGIGVGFDLRGADKITIHEPREESWTFVVPDTREGWSESQGLLLESYFLPNKKTVKFDYSQLREEGVPLKRFGGHSSGPEPLRRLHQQMRTLLGGRDGQKLSGRDILDIANMEGKAAVSGGSRRSAEICLGLPDDKDFINAKNWEVNPERMGADGWGHLSNNSVMIEANEDVSHLFDLIATNGEPGIINLGLARQYGRLGEPNDKDTGIMGINPCAEIFLESYELCNLTDLYLPNIESKDEFLRTIKYAYMYSKAVTLLPTPWDEVNEVIVRNRRIGTSVTGVTQFLEDNSWAGLDEWLDEGYYEIQLWDTKYSKWLGVRESIKTTSVKPSGTTGLVGSVTPGAHWPVASGEYLRRQRFNHVDPMVPLFRAAGYHVEPDFMDPDFTVVVTFPTVGPRMRSEKDVSIWEKAALAAKLQKSWADNAVSVTITFDPETEAAQVGSVVRAHMDQLKSMSFLPMSNTTYKQMPYETVSMEQWTESYNSVSHIDWTEIYESKGLAAVEDKFCTTDSCEIDFSKLAVK